MNLDPGTCRTCGRLIYWVALEGGKRMPVDRERQQIVVDASAMSTGVAGAGRVATGYRSHFATCPHAKQHRRG